MASKILLPLEQFKQLGNEEKDEMYELLFIMLTNKHQELANAKQEVIELARNCGELAERSDWMRRSAREAAAGRAQFKKKATRIIKKLQRQMDGAIASINGEL